MSPSVPQLCHVEVRAPYLWASSKHKMLWFCKRCKLIQLQIITTYSWGLRGSWAVLSHAGMTRDRQMMCHEGPGEISVQ